MPLLNLVFFQNQRAVANTRHLKFIRYVVISTLLLHFTKKVLPVYDFPRFQRITKGKQEARR